MEIACANHGAGRKYWTLLKVERDEIDGLGEWKSVYLI